MTIKTKSFSLCTNVMRGRGVRPLAGGMGRIELHNDDFAVGSRKWHKELTD